MAGGNRPPPLVLRVIPLQLYAGRAWVVLERNLRVYRRAWMIIVSGFFEPVFYLFALGQGLGSLVGTVDAGPARSATRRTSRPACWRPRR